jgi:heat-inducible transcriptional repressor
MNRPFSLTGRNLEILSFIVRSYIATGEPVGSKTISEKRRDHLSPASIRNVMAELEAEGYLTHPHTSAGRVPTDKAFRHYVQNLNAPRLQPSEADFVQLNLREAPTLEDRLGRSSRVLAALTRQVGIVVLAPLSGAVLQRVQFLRLSERRVLMVLVARGEVVRHRMVTPAEEISQQELDRIANYVNQNFAGWNLADARREILRRIEQERDLYDAILRRLRFLCIQGLLSPDSEAQVYLDGTPNLVDGAQSLDSDAVRELLFALEEKEKLIQLLDQCIRGEMQITQKGALGESLSVRIGLEEAYPAMKDFALIGTICDMETGVAGRIAVIGPTRMHWERALSAVAHVANVFHNLSESN